MALQSSRNLFILTTLLVSSFLSQSPRFYVETRTIQERDVQPTTTDSYDELTKSTTNDNGLTTENVLKATESTITTTTSELLTEATTIPMESISTASTESFRYLRHNQIVYEVFHSALEQCKLEFFWHCSLVSIRSTAVTASYLTIRASKV